MTQDEQRRQRRRRRATAASGPPPAPASDPSSPARAEPVGSRPDQPKAKAAKRRDAGERGLRDLVGQGSSQLGISRALRARDVNRPDDDDLAEAAELQVIRRNWRPPS